MSVPAKVTLSGDLNFANAATVLQRIEKQLRAPATELDFSSTGEVDSATVSFLLSCRRRALAHQITLSMNNMPEALAKLIELYDVGDMLPAKSVQT